MIVSVAQAQLFFLALTRVLAVIIHVPVLAGQSVPTQVRIGLGILLSIILIPWQELPSAMQSLTNFAFALAIAREILVGTLAGFASVLVFSTLQIAGELMGLGSGFAAGRILNPALENTGSALDQFFLTTTMLLFIVLNGHHSLILGLQRTFEVLPINSPLPQFTLDFLVRFTAQMLVVGVQLSLPVMGALLLTDITLGLLARVAPQVHVFFLGIPIKVGLGLAALALYFSILFPYISRMFGSVGDYTVKLMGN